MLPLKIFKSSYAKLHAMQHLTDHSQLLFLITYSMLLLIQTISFKRYWHKIKTKARAHRTSISERQTYRLRAKKQFLIQKGRIKNKNGAEIRSETRARVPHLWLTECCTEQQMIFVCECRAEIALRLCENWEIDTCVTRTRSEPSFVSQTNRPNFELNHKRCWVEFDKSNLDL